MASVAEKILENVQKVIVGKTEQIKLILIAMLAEGHVLLEDMPGVGKTMLARSIAKSIGAEFRRIQFTPDITPNDIVGLNIWSQQKNEFEFRPGPIMANIVLADEINRGTPKAQSATLEAMEEKQVTIDGKTFRLSQELFMVLATQNPIEYEGTYPLPEAQLDRFMIKISLGYVSENEALKIMERLEKRHPIEEITAVAEIKDIISAREKVKEVYIHSSVRRYIYKIVSGTRNHQAVEYGASERPLIILQRTAKAKAFIENRDFVLPEDVQKLAIPVLAHRLILRPGARARGVKEVEVIKEIIESTPQPPY